MGKQTVWRRNQYYKLRDKLIEDMGGKCEICGSTVKLEVDHKDGRDWDLHKPNRLTRIRRYRKEWEQRLVRLLCKKCNQFRWKE